MCHLFPTEVSCTVRTGGIGGNANKDNILCLLPNNVFYQYYFLILWWWWVVLIFISCLGLVYRLIQILVPQFGRLVLLLNRRGCAVYINFQKSTRMKLNAKWEAHVVSYKFREYLAHKKLKPWETFLLLRLVRNLKGSQVH